jgi:hypothetical protein
MVVRLVVVLWVGLQVLLLLEQLQLPLVQVERLELAVAVVGELAVKAYFQQ